MVEAYKKIVEGIKDVDLILCSSVTQAKNRQAPSLDGVFSGPYPDGTIKNKQLYISESLDTSFNKQYRSFIIDGKEQKLGEISKENDHPDFGGGCYYYEPDLSGINPKDIFYARIGYKENNTEGRKTIPIASFKDGILSLHIRLFDNRFYSKAYWSANNNWTPRQNYIVKDETTAWTRKLFLSIIKEAIARIPKPKQAKTPIGKSVSEAITKFIESKKDSKIKTLESQIASGKRNIDSYLKHITSIKTLLIGQDKDLVTMKQGTKANIEKIKEDIGLIKSHTDVESVKVLGQTLFVITKPLSIRFDSLDRDIKIGAYHINIDLSGNPNRDIVLIFNTRIPNTHKNYNHVHVNEGGRPCWGNIEVKIINQYKAGNILLLVYLTLKFLRTYTFGDTFTDIFTFYESVWNRKLRIGQDDKDEFLNQRNNFDEYDEDIDHRGL